MAAQLKQINDHEYHAMTGHVSSSMLKAMAKSPMHCQAMLNNAKKETESLIFGRALHKYTLEGRDAFDKDFGIKYLPWNTTPGKAEQKEFLQSGKKPIDVKDFAKIQAMAESVLAHPGAKALIDQCKDYEQAILWEDQPTGMLCRCKPDLMNPSFIIDLKSCEDASPSSFLRAAMEYGYHIQAAHYCNGHNAYYNNGQEYGEYGGVPFYFIAVEKDEPYAVAVYKFNHLAMEYGRQRAAKLMDDYAHCHMAGVWPGYSTMAQYMAIPTWKRNQDAE